MEKWKKGENGKRFTWWLMEKMEESFYKMDK